METGEVLFVPGRNSWRRIGPITEDTGKGSKNQTQHGPFAPETLLSFFTTTGHSAILLAGGNPLQ